MTPCRFSALLLMTAMATGRLAAQKVLFAEDGGKVYAVVAARGLEPCVVEKGKVVPVHALHLALQDVPEYLPVFVSVRDVETRSTSEHEEKEGGAFNGIFYFSAKFRTRYRLSDVFVVLDIHTESGAKYIFLSEVRDLVPSEVRLVSLQVPLASVMAGGHYSLHVFSQGAEVLQTEIPIGVREAALDRMVAKRIVAVRDEAPTLFVGPSPEYPAEFTRANRAGRATIAVRIGVNGGVYDPVIKDATDPAFGKAALRAVRQWRFLPMVKDGRPVATPADVPIIFSPPVPEKVSS